MKVLNYKLRLVACALLFAISPAAIAQKSNTDATIQSIERNASDNSPVSILLSPAANLHEGQEQEAFTKYLGAGSNTMHLVSTNTTKAGLKVKRYSQSYKDIKVALSGYTVTTKEGVIRMLSGNYYNIAGEMNEHPAIARTAAFSKALAFVGAEKYMWEIPSAEKQIKTVFKKDTTYLPAGNLVWVEDRMTGNSDRALHLAWMFDIYAQKPLSRQEVYVDAATGKILFSNAMIKHTAVTVGTKYSRAVPSVTSLVGGTYLLYDSTRGNGIYTQDMNNGTTSFDVTDFTSPFNIWPTVTSDSVALDAHWGAEMVYDYWLSQQGRHSWDDLDGILQQYVHYDVGLNNAFWDGTEMMYGDGTGVGAGGFDPLTCLDVVGHEIGHGVCQATAGLIYEKESGAMNEGLSDCWGATIEHWADPHEGDAYPKLTWWIGEEITNNNPLRRMDFPKLKGQPDTYGGTNWYSVTSCTPDGSNDQCGVHRNSGVFNKWYFLITDGGSGTNDNGNAYSVTGVGWTEAPNILYQTELVLPSTATYAQARTASINIATVLYGACSAEVKAVTDAWYAVGVGAAFVSSVAAITGPISVCSGQTITLNDVTPAGSWSSSNSLVATVGTGAGLVSGVAAGTAAITYSIGPACFTAKNIVVNTTPAAYSVTGGGSYCSGGTGVHIGLSPSQSAVNYQLYSGGTTVGGTVGGTGGAIDFGLLTAIGTYTVSATSASGGCTTAMAGSAVIIINPLPIAYAVTGGGNYCSGGTGVHIGMFDTDPGYTYRLYNGGTLSGTAAGTGSAADFGLITAAGTYTATATNTTTGCSNAMTGSATVAVLTTPVAISGTGRVCTGVTTSLSDATPAGVWSSVTTSVASIGTSGTVTGVTAGTAVISYTLGTGCTVTTIVTVNPSPAAITGTSTLCDGTSSTLSNTLGGGNWTSVNTGVALIDVSLGTLSGSTAGTSTISYTMPTGCTATTVATVRATPAAITGIPDICTALTTTLGDVTPAGAWTSSNTSVATVSAGTTGGAAVGTAIISYTILGCSATLDVTVHTPPGAITGSTTICTGSTSTLGNAIPGGVWTSANTAVASANAATGDISGVTIGTSTIVYTMGAGCSSSTDVDVIMGAGPITGTTFACLGGTTSLGDVVPLGTWASSSAAVATITAAGLVSGVSAGTAVITYTVGSGCTATAVVTVSPAVAGTISGVPAVCAGQVTTLGATVGGGVWSSSNPAVASAGSASGIISGVAAGTAIISYTVTNACGSAVTARSILVNALPSVAAITGATAMCAGATTTLANSTPSGNWSSGATAIASVSATGVVSGIGVGTAAISYTVTNAAGCAGSAVAAVSVTTPLMPVVTPSGALSFCTGSSKVLSATTGAGYTYQWTKGGVLIPGATASSLTVTTPMGTGSYAVVLNSGSGCVATSAITVLTLSSALSVVPAVSLAALPGTSLCSVAAPVTFTPSATNGGAAPAYQWYVNGTPAAAGSTYAYTPAAGDMVTVRLASSDACAYPDTAVASATISIVAPSAPAVSVVVAPNDTVCAGSMVTVTPVPTFGGSAPAYSWTKNGLTAHLGATYSYVPANGDIIACNMTSNYFCVTTPSATSPSLVLHVAPVNSNSVIISTASSDIVAGMPTTFVAVAPFAGATPGYQWFVNFVAVPGATSGIFVTSALAPGDMVTCRLTSSDPCTVPATITSNGITVNVVTSGIRTITSNSAFTLLPNPNNGSFTLRGTVSSTDDSHFSVSVTNMLGQAVYTGTLQPHNGVVNEPVALAGTLANGVYLVSIVTGSDHVVFSMIVSR